MQLFVNFSNMLWWKQLESAQENIMMIEKEEQRKDFIEKTTVTLTLPSINPVMQDEMFIANIEQVKSLQASLFPICSKGKLHLCRVKRSAKTFKFSF